MAINKLNVHERLRKTIITDKDSTYEVSYIIYRGGWMQEARFHSGELILEVNRKGEMQDQGTQKVGIILHAAP